ncbi:MAG: hypothetical protein HOV80_14745, partial [Polyangiaceae bacterium]|nr:hypothetical protein [Polyangiaceae bacterium]
VPEPEDEEDAADATGTSKEGSKSSGGGKSSGSGMTIGGKKPGDLGR